MQKTTRLLVGEVESSSSATPQSNAIHRAIVSDLKAELAGIVTEWKISKMHFETSVFIKTRSGKIWNIFTGDYRWSKDITMRTATSFTDYTGGSNISLGRISPDTASKIKNIIEGGERRGGY